MPKLCAVQYADEMSEFDVVDKVGNDYWFKTTGKLHVSEGIEFFKKCRSVLFSQGNQKS